MHTHHKIKYTHTVHAPIEKVWDALTNPEIVKQYFFGTNLKSDWKQGSTISFSGEYEGTPYEDKGTILSIKENDHIEYSYLSSWANKEDKPENYLWVKYSLEPSGDDTLVTVEQSNYDEATCEHSLNNWKGLLAGMANLVENNN